MENKADEALVVETEVVEDFIVEEEAFVVEEAVDEDFVVDDEGFARSTVFDILAEVLATELKDLVVAVVLEWLEVDIVPEGDETTALLEPVTNVWKI